MANNGYAPYEESSAKAALRIALAGLAASARVPQGANFLQGLGVGASSALEQQAAAQKAAEDYAMKQMDREAAREDRELRRQFLEAQLEGIRKPPKPEKQEPWQLPKVEQDRLIDFETRRAKALADAKPKEVKEPEKPKLGDYDKMSDNFRSEPAVKDYGTVRDSYRRIVNSSKLGSGFGDLAMIFSFMKVLDPGSTVREGEFANAQQAMGQLQKAYNVPKQWWTGTRLTPAGRAGLLKAAESFHDAQKSTYDATVKRYKKTATKYGVDPSDVITEYDDAPTGVTADNDPLGIR